MRNSVLLASLLFTVLLPGARAQVFFTGALMYGANNSGTNVGGASEYDTFVTPNTGNSKFTINGATDIAYSLSPGSNAFAIGGATIGTYTGLGLFFSNTATPGSGPFAAVPDLVVVDNASSGTTFFFAPGGAMVATYGQFSGDVSYSGATSYQIGGYEVTVTAYDMGAAGNNLTLFVAAIPEPTTSSALAGVLVIGWVMAMRRRRAG
jgi:hypothetical protein